MTKVADQSRGTPGGLSQKQRIIATTALFGVLFGAALFVELREPTRPSADSTQRLPAPAEPLTFSTVEALIREKADYDRMAALVRLVREAKWPPAKGEYETTIEYRERLKSRGPGIGRYPPGTAFVLLLPAAATYNTDAKEMTVAARPLSSAASTGLDRPMSFVTESATPAVVLASDVGAAAQYVGQNAFGVARNVSLVQEVQTLLLPLADLAAPAECDFRYGRSMYKDDVANAETMIKWACGLVYIDRASLEKLDRFQISLAPARARQIASSELQVAYVVSFDDLPEGVSLFKGPVQFGGSQPTLDNPTEFRVIGDAISARLRKVLVYSRSHGLLHSKSYE